MTEPPEPPTLSTVELLLLARTGVAKKAQSAAELVKSLRPLAFPTWSAGQAREHLLVVRQKLVARGLLAADGRLADAGARALCQALGVSRVPAWRVTRSRHLPALGLGLARELAERALTDGESLQATVLARELGLPPAPTLTALTSSLLTRELGLPAPAAGRRVTLATLAAQVLAKGLGVEARGKTKDIARRAAAARLGAPRGGKAALCDALVRRWATAGAPAAATPASAVAGAVAGTHRARAGVRVSADPALRALVPELVRQIGPAGRFGPEKVFVAALWRRLEADPRCPAGLDLAAFQRWLLAANTERWITLARADLVGAMDAELVAASELRDRGATFHFVLDEQALA